METQRAGAARSRKGAKQPPVLIEVCQLTRQCRVSEIERQRTQKAALIDTSRHLHTEQSQERTRQVTTTEEAEAREAAETPTEIAQQRRTADMPETGEVLLRRQNREVSQLTERRRQYRIRGMERQRTRRAALTDDARNLETEQAQDRMRLIRVAEIPRTSEVRR